MAKLTSLQEVRGNVNPVCSKEANVVESQEIWEPRCNVQIGLQQFKVIQRQCVVIASRVSEDS